LGNTAIGSTALFGNTTGTHNTAIGEVALDFNSTGNSNIALGFNAGSNVDTASNVICIGVIGADVSNSCFIGSIFGQPVNNNTGSAVFVDGFGKLGTVLSAQRFKHDIQPMDKASEVILALKPVTFHYKNDANNTPCFGLIAEDVAEVNPDLIVRDKNGEVLSVRYDQINAMLLNEFLKEHRTVQEQKATIAELRQNFEEQQKQIQALAAGLQKVSAQFGVSKRASQVADKD